MIKSFLALAVIALVLGVSLGGAFVGGSIYGRSTASNNAGNNAGNPAGAPLGGGRTSVKPSAADRPRRGPAALPKADRPDRKEFSGRAGSRDVALQPPRKTPNPAIKLTTRRRSRPGRGAAWEPTGLRAAAGQPASSRRLRTGR